MNEEAALPMAHDRDRSSRLGQEPVPFPGTVKTGLASRGWMVDLATWFHSLAEVEDAGPADPSEEEVVSEDEALSGIFVKVSDELLNGHLSCFIPLMSSHTAFLS
jgi:hypothetical protein